MADGLDDCYGTYRCPVCGYYDAATLARDQRDAVVRCCHCDTSLEIFRRGPYSVRFSVQVTGQRAARH